MSVYIVAELGINANSSRDMALDLIKMAADCGCDAIKTQKRTIDVVYSQEFLDSPRASPWGSTQREQKEALEFSEQDYNVMWPYAKSLGLDFFGSAWDEASLNFLEKYDPPHHKIASAMATNLEFCRSVACLGRHTFISTGMCIGEEVDNVVEIFMEEGTEFTLLHCVSTYPTPPEHINLNAIKTLQEEYSAPVGYSGHETGIGISLAAVAMGATVIERHITLDRSFYGSDQSASLERDGLRRLVAGIREIEKAMGDGRICMAPGEEAVAASLRYWRENG